MHLEISVETTRLTLAASITEHFLLSPQYAPLARGNERQFPSMVHPCCPAAGEATSLHLLTVSGAGQFEVPDQSFRIAWGIQTVSSSVTA